MYEAPGQPNISEVIVNEDVIEKHAAPMVTYGKDGKDGGKDKDGKDKKPKAKTKESA